MVPKLCGMDVELGNFIAGRQSAVSSGAEASRLLLAAIDGVPALKPTPAPARRLCPCGCGAWVAVADNAQDQGRKFLANGGSAYIDLNHCELASPETRSARDQVACLHAMLRLAQRAQTRVNARRDEGARVEAMFNNSDGFGNSYGSHVNILMSRHAWDRMFQTRLLDVLYMAAFQASAIVFTGQGKVGAENGGDDVPFQLSQRADFFETVVGPQTTAQRPLVNTRDEALCGERLADWSTPVSYARLHIIGYDATFCHMATWLKLGVLQLVVAMLEAGVVTPAVLLDDPVAAVKVWSHDPALRATCRLVDGRRVTAVEHQWMFLEHARPLVESGRCVDIVPHPGSLLAHWERVLSRLQSGAQDELAGQLDWVLKQRLLREASARSSAFEWASPQAKHLDLLYASLDTQAGAYWACEAAGLTEQLVSDDEIERFTWNPPEDTRAWTRGMLVARGALAIERVDWDAVWLRVGELDGAVCTKRVLLDDPLGWTRNDVGGAFAGAAPFREVVNQLLEGRQGG